MTFTIEPVDSSKAPLLAEATRTYWEVGRRIMEFEQGGKGRAEYGAELLQRLAIDLTQRFGRGFSLRNLRTMRSFYAGWPIRQTLSAEFAIRYKNCGNFANF